MAVLSKLLEWCCIHTDQELRFSEKHSSASGANTYAPYKDNSSKTELADEIVAKLLAAEKNDAALQADLRSIVHEYGWFSDLATAILATLEKAIKTGDKIGPAMKTAYDKAVTAVNKVEEWAEAHPEMTAVIVTLVALGVLAIMMPWLMAYLGFSEEGIIEASWAAGWQATYRGFVPKGSLFSYLQSLGTKIGRNWRG